MIRLLILLAALLAIALALPADLADVQAEQPDETLQGAESAWGGGYGRRWGGGGWGGYGRGWGGGGWGGRGYGGYGRGWGGGGYYRRGGWGYYG